MTRFTVPASSYLAGYKPYPASAYPGNISTSSPSSSTSSFTKRPSVWKQLKQSWKKEPWLTRIQKQPELASAPYAAPYGYSPEHLYPSVSPLPLPLYPTQTQHGFNSQYAPSSNAPYAPYECVIPTQLSPGYNAPFGYANAPTLGYSAPPNNLHLQCFQPSAPTIEQYYPRVEL